MENLKITAANAVLAFMMFAPLLFFVLSLVAGYIGNYNEATWLVAIAIFTNMKEHE